MSDKYIFEFLKSRYTARNKLGLQLWSKDHKQFSAGEKWHIRGEVQQGATSSLTMTFTEAVSFELEPQGHTINTELYCNALGNWL